MSRLAFKQAIYDLINVSAVTNLLGSALSTGSRVLYGWPQTQPVLSDAPTEPNEGWLTFHERSSTMPFEGIRETIMLELNIFATRMSLCDQVLDQLDGILNWKYAGHGGLSPVGGRDILLAQRVQTQELYEDDRSQSGGPKLYRKMAVYSFATVKRPMKSGV